MSHKFVSETAPPSKEKKDIKKRKINNTKARLAEAMTIKEIKFSIAIQEERVNGIQEGNINLGLVGDTI